MKARAGVERRDDTCDRARLVKKVAEGKTSYVRVQLESKSYDKKSSSKKSNDPLLLVTKAGVEIRRLGPTGKQCITVRGTDAIDVTFRREWHKEFLKI